jgi:phosphatidylserine/phosphatidylglycerophosphate/cardiolipin synthase-like enzyme
LCVAASPSRAWADQVYFSATQNIRDVLIQRINAETVRIDMSAWYLTDHLVSLAVANRFNAGVPVRLMSDRGSMFEIDPLTKSEFYWLANQGVPIRLRYNPNWYPEINHWKATIFVGQNRVMFGSANYTPFELAPFSSTNYKDEVVLLSDDPELVNAFKTKFDRMWNDTTVEPQSLIRNPPFFMNWDDACAREGTPCADYYTRYPNPAPMIINTGRLEPDYPMPADMDWGQGSVFNSRLAQAINAEPSSVDFVIYRLTVDTITNALIARHNAGVQVRLIVEPNEYLNRKWPEFWITHAHIDKLWAAGIPIKKRVHDGLTHMKTLITSTIATIASSNFTVAWQRDHNYFVPAATKGAIHQAIKTRFQQMWTGAGFADFTPGLPDPPTQTAPANGATGVSQSPTLTWNRAPFATDYDVLLGTSGSNMTVVGNVQAQLTNSPPTTYSLPVSGLAPGTTYYWRIKSRTNATPINPAIAANSSILTFTTAGTPGGPPPAPSSPSPANGATGVSTTPTLTWAAGPAGTTYNVAFGTVNPPPQVATGRTTASYVPGTLTASTLYYWRITAVSSGGSTAGSVWSFRTGTGGGSGAPNVVLYASDVSTMVGAWSRVSDSTAAGGSKMRSPDSAGAIVDSPLANPPNYFQATFTAQANTRYRVWFRIHAINDSKFNDSFYVQFSDSVNSAGTPVYRIGTTSGYMVNLWTCSTCQSIGWGWQRNAYWLPDTGDVWFPTTGQHTIRVQVREDGAEIDQIVLSPSTYATNPPGPVSNDNTIVPKPTSAGNLPGTPASPNPADGATAVSLNASLSWTATDATSYDLAFGTTNPPPVIVNDTAQTTYAPPDLESGGTYFWSVVARNADGTTAGPVWSFSTVEAPPAEPNSPNPADGAANVNPGVTLTWASAGASSYDVLLDTSDPPSQVASGITSASYTPTLSPDTTYFWQIVAHNSTGDVQGPVWTFTTGAAAPPPIDEIVIYASDVPASALHGGWATHTDASSPNNIRLATPDAGLQYPNAPLASPAHYFDVTFDAEAGKTYTLWLRVRALNESKYNDAVWVQFSDALSGGSPIYQIGTTSALLVNLATTSAATSLNGWGWANGAYWLTQPTTLTFPTSGPHTLRVQIREDGVMVDQIVLSHVRFLTVAPGPPTNDSTIVAKP